MSKTRNGVAPLPHYAMPDASEPPYSRILEQVQDYEHSLIGSSYFYIRACGDRFDLCRIVYGGGTIYFHELVDYENHGISEDDMEVSVREDMEFSTLPGHCPISRLIEEKLRILYEQ
jgi:hypothetical protein